MEDLAVGDRLITAFGQVRPVRWIGHRRVLCHAQGRPELVWPVRVSASTFAPNLPARDLWLSPDHSVYVDGVLVPVKHLMNGRSIAQVPVRETEYWHVELDRHDVILAEGLPVESYLDTESRHALVGETKAGPMEKHSGRKLAKRSGRQPPAQHCE